jgi:hypothetical protein
MKLLWCWRCKANVPMLDDDEWKIVWDAYSSVKNGDGRPVALAEYERLTGYQETNFNALFDHRISRLGPPCSNCGKVLRTPIAYKCFECGCQIHEPNWTYLLQLKTDAFSFENREPAVIVDLKAVADRLAPNDRIEFREGGRVIGRARVCSIEHVNDLTSVGLFLELNFPYAKIKQGQDVWLVPSK